MPLWWTAEQISLYTFRQRASNNYNITIVIYCVILILRLLFLEKGAIFFVKMIDKGIGMW